jgi:O-antigen/teichoic acid export membrane protein
VSSRAGLVARNGVANVIRAAAASAAGVFLPIVLLGVLSHSSYPAWALIFSIASYVTFFDVGMPASVQSLVARAHASGHAGAVRRAAISGMTVSTIVVASFLVVAGLISVLLGAISPDMAPAIRAHAAPALLIVAVGQGASLLSNTAAAYYSGLQRSAIPALVVAPARLLCFLSCGVVAYVSQSLELTAIAFAVPNIVAFTILGSMILWETRGAAHKSAGRNYSVVGLLRYAGPLILWSLMLLASTGLGVAIVARFAYRDLVPFALAQVIYTGIYGLSTAIGTPLLPEFARTAVQTPELLPQKVILATRIHSALLYSIAGAAAAAIPLFLYFAAGRAVEHASAWGTAIALVWAASIHMSASPLSMAFIATTRHHRLILAPTMQGISTVVLSLALAPLLGGLGVAIGTAIGACVGLTLACYWSVRRAGLGGLQGHTVAIWAFCVPAIGLVVGTVFAVLACTVLPISLLASAVVSFAALCSVIAWAWCVVLPDRERAALANVLRERVRRRR